MTSFQKLVRTQIATTIGLALRSPLFQHLCLWTSRWFYLPPHFCTSTWWNLIYIFACPTQGHLLHELINDFVIWSVLYEPGVQVQGCPLHLPVSPAQGPEPMDATPQWDYSAWIEFSHLTSRDWHGEHVGRSIRVLLPKDWKEIEACFFSDIKWDKERKKLPEVTDNHQSGRFPLEHTIK